MQPDCPCRRPYHPPDPEPEPARPHLAGDLPSGLSLGGDPMIRAIYDASMLGALTVACWGLDQLHAGVHALERLAAREPSAKAKEEKETRPRRQAA